MSDEELIWLSAFRYALGRKTYIVAVVSDWLKSHASELSTQAKTNIIKEINNPYRGDLGHDCDKQRWLNLRDYLLLSIKNETN